MKLMASQAVQQQPFKIIDGSGGWRDRCAKWCERHLAYLDGGALAYADTMGPGKTAALSLRGYLFDDTTLSTLEEAGVDIEYPANLRESEQEPKKLKPVPADATQRAQYYADLRADDIVLLKDVIARLGCQPRREKEPPWLPFGRIFNADKPNPQAAPIEIYELTRARYWKLVDDMGSSYEADLVSAWHQVVEHLIKDVFTGERSLVGNRIAENRSSISNPTDLFAFIKARCQVAHDHRHDFSFSHALQAQGDAAERKPGDKQQTTPWQRKRQNDDTLPSNKKSGDAGKPSGERPPKKARSAAEAKEQPCRHFLKGSCKFGADCKFSHDQQPQTPASKATAAKAGQTPRPKTAPSANKFTENGKTWIRDRKDGKFYEYSQCAFCLAPGDPGHTKENCPERIAGKEHGCKRGSPKP